jgi:hypothetical protein
MSLRKAFSALAARLSKKTHWTRAEVMQLTELQIVTAHLAL